MLIPLPKSFKYTLYRYFMCIEESLKKIKLLVVSSCDKSQNIRFENRLWCNHYFYKVLKPKMLLPNAPLKVKYGPQIDPPPLKKHHAEGVQKGTQTFSQKTWVLCLFGPQSVWQKNE